tara:strand:+ start:310 stop:723 length:414 start_codon:yes stop_codon:yes gene_type:complete
MREKFEDKNMNEIDANEKDLFLQIDFLQEKVDKFEENEALKRKEILEEEVLKRNEIIEEINFYRQSTIDLINQINHVQDLLLKKIKDYDGLKLQNNCLIEEVSIIYDNLDKYKILSFEQNKQILRAINLIKKKKKLK